VWVPYEGALPPAGSGGGSGGTPTHPIAPGGEPTHPIVEPDE
jgi:hypothetical protein